MRTLAFVLVLALAPLSAALVPATAATAPITVTITDPVDVPFVQGIAHGFETSGSVLVADAATGVGIADAGVKVVVTHDLSGRFVSYNGRTDATGVFEFSLRGAPLADGTYAPPLPGQYSIEALGWHSGAVVSDEGSYRVHILGVAP